MLWVQSHIRQKILAYKNQIFRIFHDSFSFSACKWYYKSFYNSISNLSIIQFSFKVIFKRLYNTLRIPYTLASKHQYFIFPSIWINKKFCFEYNPTSDRRYSLRKIIFFMYSMINSLSFLVNHFTISSPNYQQFNSLSNCFFKRL